MCTVCISSGGNNRQIIGTHDGVPLAASCRRAVRLRRRPSTRMETGRIRIRIQPTSPGPCHPAPARAAHTTQQLCMQWALTLATLVSCLPCRCSRTTQGWNIHVIKVLFSFQKFLNLAIVTFLLYLIISV